MYEPTPVASDSPPGLAQWLTDQLRRVANVLRAPEVNSVRFTILHKPPARFADGDLVYADGTDWNPGAGRGLYERRSSAWQKL